MTDTAIEKKEAAPLAQFNPANPFLATIETAIAKKIGAEELNRLLDAAERVDNRLAKQAFTDALIAFQADCPPIPKSSTATIVTQKGTYAYDYPPLEDCERIAMPFLHKHGLARRYGDVTKDGESVTVACILDHRGGHSEATKYTADRESRGGLSGAQKGGAAETYAKRRAFINAAGLRIVGEDTDGAGDAEPPETITEEQANQLNDLIIQVTDGVKEKVEAWKTKLLKATGAWDDSVHGQIDGPLSLADIPAVRFDEYAGKIQKAIDDARKKGT
jgi:hypothetical protein